jgi:hypothetical protein
MDTEETRRIVRDTVEQTLISIGLDISDPDAIKSMQKNMAWVENRRLLEEKLSWKIVATVAVFFVGGLLSALILGFKTILNIN